MSRLQHISTYEKGWRADYPVFVPDAHAVAMVGVIRSLGRAGYPVHACADQDEALGLHSSFASTTTICPAYDSAEYCDWLRDYVNHHQIRAIVPTEGVMLAVRPCFEEFQSLLPVSPNAGIVYAGLSKFDLFQSLQNSADDGIVRYLPPMLLIGEHDSVPSVNKLQYLGPPLYIKADKVYGSGGRPDNLVVRAETAEHAYKILVGLRTDYARLLVQGHVPGKGVAVALLIRKGRVEASFMNLCLHESPHTGGFCTLRESWWHETIYDHAERVVRCIGWEGITMLEYRWDKVSDTFHLIEMNPRFWAALHVALYAGADLPRLLLDGHFYPCDEQFSAAFNTWHRGVRCRLTIPGEIGYVLSCLRDRNLPAVWRIWPTIEFIALSVDPRVRSDLYFPGDRGLYWRALKQLFSDFRATLRQHPPV